jgi:hypothetical protein
MINPPVASAANKRTISSSDFAIIQLPSFSLGSILSRYPTLRLCSQFRQEFVDLTTRKPGLIADISQGHHHRPRAQRHIQVVSKYARLDATFQQIHQVGVPIRWNQSADGPRLPPVRGCRESARILRGPNRAVGFRPLNERRPTKSPGKDLSAAVGRSARKKKSPGYFLLSRSNPECD